MQVSRVKLARIFVRGFSQVVLVAGNTVQLAAYQRTHDAAMLPAVFAVACAISFVWWANARSTTRDENLTGARWVYALGAGTGTIIGAMFIAWWYR